MKKNKLNKVLKIANMKKQIGVIIYLNEKAWEDLSKQVVKGGKFYENALENIITKQKETIVKAKTSYDETVIAFLCIPVRKALDSQEYFNQIVDYCDEHLINGPFVLVPSNEMLK